MPAQTRNQKVDQENKNKGMKQLLLGEASKIKPDSKRIKKPFKTKTPTISAPQSPSRDSNKASKVKKSPKVSKTKSAESKKIVKDEKPEQQQLLKDVGAVKLLDSIDLNKVLDRKR